MKSIAIYARVSSEQQKSQATINSQITELIEKTKSDGYSVVPSNIHADDGYSGSSLVRPALEKLRDQVAEGAIDILYVHSPDRLARRYAYQVLLLEEFSQNKVSIIFLNGASGHTAEDQLLVQVQGVIAEFERAKILERSRRGKLHKAKAGIVNVLSAAPYGYQYIRKGDWEPARYQILLHEAKVVRQVYSWFIDEGVSIFEIAKRLTRDQIPTKKGNLYWGTSSVWSILRNPAYCGRAAFGKTETAVKSVMLRPPRGRTGIARREKSSSRRRAASEWLTVPVPAIVAEDIFEAARQQLARNLQLSSRNCQGKVYLLQGLVVCKLCDFGFYGRTMRRPDKPSLSYYRCGGSDGHRLGGKPVCRNHGVRVDLLDDYVWKSVCSILQDPDQVMNEWTRRNTENGPTQQAQHQFDEAKKNLADQEKVLSRLQDAYEAGALTVQELTERTTRLRGRIKKSQHELTIAQGNLLQAVELKAIYGKLAIFAEQVKIGLDKLDWSGQQQLVRNLVSRIEIDAEGANIVYRIPGPTRQPGESVVSEIDVSKNCQLHPRRVCTQREIAIKSGA